MVLGMSTTAAQGEFLMQSEPVDAACEHSSPVVQYTLTAQSCTGFIVFKGLNMTFHLSSSAFSLLLA